MKTLRTTILAAALLLTPAACPAFSGGPPNGRTNAPGETTCTDCHTTFALNSGLGAVTVDGVGGGWLPDVAYDLTVTVADPAAARWGYEFTILDGNGASVGQLTVLDNLSQLSTSGARVYAKQTGAGTQAGTTGSADWTVRWTAPSTPVGPVSIHVAGNAANNNGANSGDHIYTASQVWAQSAVSAADLPPVAAVELRPNVPNPFNPRTTIAWSLERASHVRLTVYSLDGRRVRTLVDGSQPAGAGQAAWDGQDARGRAMPSGVYLYRLEAAGEVVARRMTLVR
jgi:hypothetical protein